MCFYCTITIRLHLAREDEKYSNWISSTQFKSSKKNEFSRVRRNAKNQLKLITVNIINWTKFHEQRRGQGSGSLKKMGESGFSGPRIGISQTSQNFCLSDCRKLCTHFIEGRTRKLGRLGLRSEGSLARRSKPDYLEWECGAVGVINWGFSSASNARDL